jgi:hypothetical protein
MSAGSRTRQSETDRPASGEMAWQARVAQPPIRSRPRRWRGRLLLVIGPLRIAPLLQRHSVAEEASAFGTRHDGVRAAGPLRVCSSTTLHTVAPAPLSATGAIPVPRRDGIGVTAFVRKGKRRVSASSAPARPLLHTQELGNVCLSSACECHPRERSGLAEIEQAPAQSGLSLASERRRLAADLKLTAGIRPFRQRTLARFHQAPTAARAGKRVRRGDPPRRRTVNPVEMRTFGENRGSFGRRMTSASSLI